MSGRLSVTVTSTEPWHTDTYTDALAVVVIHPGGAASGAAVDTYPDAVFALTLREIADRIDPPPGSPRTFATSGG